MDPDPLIKRPRLEVATEQQRHADLAAHDAAASAASPTHDFAKQVVQKAQPMAEASGVVTGPYQTVRRLDNLAPGAELASSSSSSSSSSSQPVLLLRLPRQQLQDLPQLQRLVQQSVALRHPNVLHVHELYLEPQHLVVVMEGCSHHSLLEFLQQRRQQGRQLSEAAARCLFLQVVLAVDCCHTQGLDGLPIQHTLLQESSGRPPMPKVLCPLFALAHSSSNSSSWPGSTAVHGRIEDMRSCGMLLLHLLGGQLSPAAPEAAAAAAASSSSAMLLLPKSRSPDCQQLLQQLLAQSPAHMLCSTRSVMSSSWFEQGLPEESAELNQQDQLCRQTDVQLADIVAAVHAWPPGFAVYQQLADLAAAQPGLLMQQQQAAAGLGSSWCHVYEAHTAHQAEGQLQPLELDRQPLLAGQSVVWMCCLPAHPPKQVEQEAAAEQHSLPTQHPALLQSSSREVFTSKPPSPALLRAIRQLQTAANSADIGLVPVFGLCLHPPLLLEQAPPVLQLPQGPMRCSLAAWLQSQPQCSSGMLWLDSTNTEEGSSSSSSSSNGKAQQWVAEVGWACVLQLLCDVAAALVQLHSLQPPMFHGAVHAGAVHLLSGLLKEPAFGQRGQRDLLSGLPTEPASSEEAEPDLLSDMSEDSEEHAFGQQAQHDIAPDEQRQQPQQQQQVAQLSWVGPWRLEVSSTRTLCHPLLTPPEVLQQGAAFSAAADVFGLGVVMLQLAACWVPFDHPIGSAEQWNDIESSLQLLEQHGTLLAALEQQQEPQFISWQQQLPDGYWELLCSCCMPGAAARPSAAEAHEKLQVLLGNTSGTQQLQQQQQPKQQQHALVEPSRAGGSFSAAVSPTASGTLGRFQIIRELGRGSSGVVVLARDLTTGAEVAVKRVEPAHLQRLGSSAVEHNIINHSQLRHPHVVQCREVLLSQGHINIVMDYVSGGSLFDYVRLRIRLREPLARWFFQQLILAIDYCYQKGEAKPNIKLENILLQVLPNLPRPLLKICNFQYQDNCQYQYQYGKQSSEAHACFNPARAELAYMPLEVLQSMGTFRIAKAADMWSCGVVLYTMLVGRYPFSADGASYVQWLAEVRPKMKRQDYELPDSLNLTSACMDLLSALLHPDHMQRAKIADVMADPWFLTDLPPDALSMNAKYLAMKHACPQTEQDIQDIVSKFGQGLVGPKLGTP